TLPVGALRGVADAFRGHPSGLGRAGAIIVGLGITAVGYIATKLNTAIAKPDQVPQLQTS
ncbi:MAG: hypothetical protein ACRETC_11750, partial [Gammaproteobacteria bacterium]